MHEPDDERLVSAIESILLVRGEPVPVTALATALGASRSRTADALQRLQTSLQRGIRLQIHDGHAQLVSAPENAEIVQRLLGTTRPAPLSRAALETLAIIAYRQPVTRAEVEAMRGVNSDRAVMTLLARDLIVDVGRRNTIGHPQELGTTFTFLEYFGLESLDQLPPLVQEDSVPLSTPAGHPPGVPLPDLGLRALRRADGEDDGLGSARQGETDPGS